jgi:hypothetical protein
MKNVFHILIAVMLLFGHAVNPVFSAELATCPPGSLGSGGMYNPSRTRYASPQYCLNGMILYEEQRYCPPGKLGGGGAYNPPDYCSEGHVFYPEQRYCPAGRLGGGGIYSVPSYCIDGLRLEEYQSYCPGKDQFSGRIYNNSTDRCEPLDGGITPVLISHVSGEVIVVDKQGRQRTLNAGDGISEKDVIRTGSDGRLTANLKDQSTVQVFPDSQVGFTELRYEKGMCSSNSVCQFTVDLTKGFLRWMTGKLTYKDRVKVQVPNAAFGIRGTDFEIAYISQAEKYPGISPGTYVRVNQGTIFVDLKGKKTDIQHGNIAYIKDSETQPVIIKEMPLIFLHFQ